MATYTVTVPDAKVDVLKFEASLSKVPLTEEALVQRVIDIHVAQMEDDYRRSLQKQAAEALSAFGPDAVDSLSGEDKAKLKKALKDLRRAKEE